MSRCFPYPPSNYCKDTQSIKLQREQETAKERRKEKKREKKDRKEKKDKSKDKCETSKHREHGHKKRKYEETNKLQMNDCYWKAATKVETEQLEKSGLTEEHGLPSLPQEPCESSESTQNSSKSRKLVTTNISSRNNGSTVFCLRLSLRKHKDQKLIPVNDEPCFSGQAIEAPIEREFFHNACRPSSYTIKSTEKTESSVERKFSNNFHSQLSATTKSGKIAEGPKRKVLVDNAHGQSTYYMTKSSKTIETAKEQNLIDNAHFLSTLESKSSRRSQKLDRKFRDLVENLKPAPLLFDTEFGSEDLEWLLKKPYQDGASVQSTSASHALEDQSKTSLLSCFQPRACYLPEFEMYQLPYTVPF